MRRQPSDEELSVTVCNGVNVRVKHIGTVSLKLNSGYNLILNDIVYVPSMRRNLISISVLKKCGFTFFFFSNKVEILCDSNLVGFGIFLNALYLLNLNFVSIVQCQSDIPSVVGSKCGRAIETSFML